MNDSLDKVIDIAGIIDKLWKRNCNIYYYRIRNSNVLFKSKNFRDNSCSCKSGFCNFLLQFSF